MLRRFHGDSPTFALSRGHLVMRSSFYLSNPAVTKPTCQSRTGVRTRDLILSAACAFAYGAGVPTLVHMCRLRDAAAFSYFVADAEATITPFRAPFISLVNALVILRRNNENNSNMFLGKKMLKFSHFFLSAR